VKWGEGYCTIRTFIHKVRNRWVDKQIKKNSSDWMDIKENHIQNEDVMILLNMAGQKDGQNEGIVERAEKKFGLTMNKEQMHRTETPGTEMCYDAG
jgi:hypothetical protein